jgi:hypothetical protein
MICHLYPVVIGMAVVCLAGCRNGSVAGDGDGVDRYMRLWRSENVSDQERAIRWFADYIQPGTPRTEVDRLLGPPARVMTPSVLYVPPSADWRSEFGLGFVFEPDDTVGDRSILPGVPRKPGEVRPGDVPRDGPGRYE